MIEFKEFNKIPRLSRECVITEKIDGTNGVIAIVANDGSSKEKDGEGKSIERIITLDKFTVYVGSRTRWLWSSEQSEIHNDNHGFAKWCKENINELLLLGEGFHYGEWWGSGIQRGYGLIKGEKRFSLFNTHRWTDDAVRPKCCYVVPIVWSGIFQTSNVDYSLDLLKTQGSLASVGFMNPEGVVIYHTASKTYFKKTILKDEKSKFEL